MRNSYCKGLKKIFFYHLCNVWYVFYRTNKDITIIIIILNYQVHASLSCFIKREWLQRQASKTVYKTLFEIQNNASSHVPIFMSIVSFLYSAKLVNFCFRTSNAKWKILNFKAFRWVNGVASFCEVNPSVSRCQKPRKKYIKFVIL